jgi:DNA-binding PadR family transcriptional regulator
MKGFNVQPEGDLQEAILEIIASYQEITAADIWFELGEGERQRSAVSHSEVNEALSRLEGRKLIRKREDEKWRLA